MRVAAITMVYNEAFFLPLWYRYYGSQLGPDNLYVIDHGSTDGSVSETFGNRIRIARDKFDDASRAVMVSDLHRALLRFYDTVIYTDVDEFIVPRGKGLAEYAASRPIAFPRCCGVNVVPDEGAARLDLFFPLLKQRPLAFPTHWYCKPLIASEPLTWAPGFHDCTAPAETDPDLYLFHLKHLSPRHPAPDFMAKLHARGNSGLLDEVDFADVFTHRKNLGLHSVPTEFLERV
jgi:hypothetical protein